MTVQQLDQIAMLRKQNYSYAFIARELSMNPNTVKSICRRNGYEADGKRKTKAELASTVFCKTCHKPITGVKKDTQFCSSACRAIWWRKNRKIIEK